MSLRTTLAALATYFVPELEIILFVRMRKETAKTLISKIN